MRISANGSSEQTYGMEVNKLTTKEKIIFNGLGICGVTALAIGLLSTIDRNTYEDTKADFNRTQTSFLATVDSSEVKDYTVSSSDDYILSNELTESMSSESTKNIPSLSSEVTESIQRYLRCDPAIPTNNSVNTYSVKPEDMSRVSIGKSMPIPDGHTDSYLFMDYTAITDTASRQYQLQYDGNAWTDNDGFRRYGDYYMVAMGSVYGQVGDTLRIWTDWGNCYDVIIGDCKGSDSVYYNSQSWYHLTGNGKVNVIELIVDTTCLNEDALVSGNCGTLEYLGGNIVKIERYE